MTVVDPRPMRRSPLSHRWDELAVCRTAIPQVCLAEEPFVTQVNVRVDPSSDAAKRIGRMLGTGLPLRPNTVNTAGQRSALWLGPDEWLIVAPDGAAEQLVAELHGSLGAEHGSVVDVSANRTTLRLTGTRARDVLETGCSVDLHPRVFGRGHCAQTMLGRANVVLWQDETVPSYRILVRASFAEYLTDWLLAAIRTEGAGR